MLRRYYLLSKPGIVYSNALTAVAGYFYASMFHIDFVVFIGLTLGIALLIAGACAYNNYLDRGIDAVMARTKKRGLVTGELGARQALTYATLATVVGLLLLAVTQNRLTLLLACIAFFDYVVLYGYTKRKTVHGTLVGTVSGALPLVMGYTAVTGRLDFEAWLLFMLMFTWQMAHFYAIALYRLEDYRAAKIPVMPAVYGIATTKLQTVAYIILFIASVLCLMIFGNLGILASLVLAIAGAWWLVKACRLYRGLNPTAWGKQVFFASLTVIILLSVSLAAGPALF